LGRIVQLKPPRARNALLVSMREKHWQSWVIRTAKHFGWKHYHPYNSRQSVPGYPDLTLVRERTIFAELKTERGVLSKAQREWKQVIEACSGVEYYLWRPRHWRQVIHVLERNESWIREEAA
jgi:hypothetical protein